MGYNDSETSASSLYEAGILSKYRYETELYTEPSYVAYNYADTEIYNRKIRILEGGQLSLSKEYNIFDNCINKDFDSNLGFVNNEKQLIKFDANNILESVVNYQHNTKPNQHLTIKYEGTKIVGFMLEGYYYDVIFRQAMSGQLFMTRGYLLSDYCDDTRFEAPNPNYTGNLDPNDIYTDTYTASDLANEPPFIESVKYAAYTLSKDADEYIHVIYNQDLPYVNTFYLGEHSPLQYFIIPSTEKQPYIDHIKVYDYNQTYIKKQYIMYYNNQKIHHVDCTDGERNIISTIFYDYDLDGNIISIREVF